MMDIRSITYTINYSKANEDKYASLVEKAVKQARASFANNGYEIRTVRFNSILIDLNDETSILSLRRDLLLVNVLAKECGVRWYNVSFKVSKDLRLAEPLLNDLRTLLSDFPQLFLSFILPKNHEIVPRILLEIVDFIQAVSRISVNGYDCFRVGVFLNPEANTPFFPFSYGSEMNSFSVALESTELISASFQKTFDEGIPGKIDKATRALTDRLIAVNKVIDSIDDDFTFQGFDASIAPFPDENISVVDLLELLGQSSYGSYGTVYLTSELTQLIKKAVKQSGVKGVGFNGVMYSLLEDKRLCSANQTNGIGINDLILYSTVCGCGLDMIPIPGEFIADEIASMILDVNTIAHRLEKPLGVRLIPIPFKWFGDKTDFNMDFLSDTSILSLKNQYLKLK